MEKVLTSRSINMCTKMRLLKCYVWSTLLYGCESWTISKRMESQLEATEIWFLRRLLRIAWTKVSNDQVLQKANTSRNLLKVIVSRQIRFVTAGCHGNLTVLNLLSASVTKNQHFRSCKKNYALYRKMISTF